MCYDTGTSPKSLCSKKEYFRDLILFQQPKLVALADPDTTAPVIGQGTLDIIINNTHRIWIFAYLTESTDTLLSAVDHLSYQDCSITGAFGKIQISFPTFTFEVAGSENFEFNILPGKSSNKPVVWQPQRSKRIDRHVSKELIKLQRICEEAIIPQRATNQATGYDVSSCKPITIAPNTSELVPLGFKMAFPSNLQCELRPRSSLSLKGINVSLGTIDPDYRGEVKVIITNTTSTPYPVAIGQRVGQLVFSTVIHPEIEMVSLLDSTTRNSGGFGSTGKNALDPKSRRVQTKRNFQPILAPIPEHRPKRKPTQLSTTTTSPPKFTIQEISTDDLNSIIDNTTKYDVEDVTPPPPPKTVYPNAIPLFPRDLYKEGQLNITGIPEHDVTASPSPPASLIEPPSDRDHHEETPPIEPTVTVDQSDDDSIYTSHPSSFEGGSTSTEATTIVNDTDIFDFLHDFIDDESTVNNSDSSGIQLPSTLHPFTSLLTSDATSKPRIPPEDRVSSTEPNTKVVTSEYFQKCFGFRNVEPILKNLKTLTKDTIKIRDTGKHPISSRGETATLPKSNRNTKPIPRPSKYGQIWHYDVVYGNGRAIGGIHYALFFVDRKSRYKMIFGLKDLKQDSITRAIKQFIRKVGFYPDELIADRDFKIIGEHVDDILEPFTQISGAPSGRQSQNGLSESNWKYICNIARNYLVEHLLPPEFWFFAIR